MGLYWMFAAAMAPSFFAAMHLGSRSANTERLFVDLWRYNPRWIPQWELIAPSHETGSFNELRAILGNTLSMTAYRKGTLPFPDGAIVVKPAWKRPAQ
jgi:hypothetical protein